MDKFTIDFQQIFIPTVSTRNYFDIYRVFHMRKALIYKVFSAIKTFFKFFIKNLKKGVDISS